MKTPGVTEEIHFQSCSGYAALILRLHRIADQIPAGALHAPAGAVIARRRDSHRPGQRRVHAAAEPVGAADAVRRIPRHGLRHGPALGEPLLQQDQDVSLRLRNFNSEKLKVNDKRGNPIEIAAAVVWRVNDTARAVLDIDHYEQYVPIQAEAALRHLANEYAYDHVDDDGKELDAARGRRRAHRQAQARAAGTLREGRPAGSKTRASRTWPTRRRSRAPCCVGSRPRR